MRPVVERDEHSAPFYDGTARGRLVLPRCSVCERFSAPETRCCALCGARERMWAEVPAEGRVATWTTVRERGEDGERRHRPVVVVEVADGPWLTMRCDGGTPTVGAAVSLTFPPADEGEAVPVAAL